MDGASGARPRRCFSSRPARTGGLRRWRRPAGWRLPFAPWRDCCTGGRAACGGERERILAEARAQLESFSHRNRVTAINEMALSLAHEISQPLWAISFNASAVKTILTSGNSGLEEALGARRQPSCDNGGRDTDTASDLEPRVFEPQVTTKSGGLGGWGRCANSARPAAA